jgi:cytochrome c oxidase assembly protein subunit 15
MRAMRTRLKIPRDFWKSRHAVALWLLGVAAIILGMVIVGGLTRLTGSGLSITEWDPIMGAIPPLNDAQWADAFAKYQRIPQYVIENRGMTLDGFKDIFWWEWSHRLLGRLVGVIFLLPFLWFAATGAIARAAWPRFVVLFALGGLQGFIGWWMVSSGLEVRVSVSQYRLAIHLGAAILLLGAILWTALDYSRDARGAPQPARRAFVFMAMVYGQMLLGALVAGLHAGLVYNSWPDMNGRLFPEDGLAMTPLWRNFFENPALVQFDHRIGAYAVMAMALFIFSRAVRLTGTPKKSGKAVAIITTIQVFIGITTLLLDVPEALAAAHQIAAALLFCAAVWHAHELRYGAASSAPVPGRR